jgi:hypothetical protein
MDRLQPGGIGLVGVIVCFAAGLFALDSCSVQKRQEERERDAALDRSFLKRASLPIEVRAMISMPGMSYQAEADLPSLQRRLTILGKRPVILVLSGCAFPIWGKDVPPGVALLDAWENPETFGDKDRGSSCMLHDATALQQSFERQLNYLVEYVEKSAWIDKERVMLVGYGEAAPIVASFTGKVKQKLTMGDPCLVPWSEIDRRIPLLMLFTDNPQGLEYSTESEKPQDIAALARGEGPSLQQPNACVGLQRPDIPSSVQEVIAHGKISLFGRPNEFFIAQKLAYDRL